MAVTRVTEVHELAVIADEAGEAMRKVQAMTVAQVRTAMHLGNRLPKTKHTVWFSKPAPNNFKVP